MERAARSGPWGALGQNPERSISTLGFNANRAIPEATDQRVRAVVREERPRRKSRARSRRHLDHQIADLPADKTYTFLLARRQRAAAPQAHGGGVYNLLPRDSVNARTHPKPPAPRSGGGRLSARAMILNCARTTQRARNLSGGVEKFPESTALLKAAGRLVRFQLWRYQEASTLLANVEQRDPSDPETHYYRGSLRTPSIILRTPVSNSRRPQLPVVQALVDCCRRADGSQHETARRVNCFNHLPGFLPMPTPAGRPPISRSPLH